MKKLANLMDIVVVEFVNTRGFGRGSKNNARKFCVPLFC
jgi:hypothetical protein